MTVAYTPYPIQEFKTGLTNYLQPWIRPIDAFEPLVNAYINRGCVNKRAGSTVFGNQLSDTNPVMGIMQYMNQSTGDTSLVVGSTTNLYLYDTGTKTFNLLTAVGGANSVFWQGTATATIPMSSFWTNWSTGVVSITDGTTTITASGAGPVNTFTSGGIFAAGSTINIITGALSINFNGSTPNTSLSISGTLVGPYFTGNITNFFNWTNWQPTDPVGFTSSVSYLYMTNDKDPITLFDGTNLSRPIFYIESTLSDYVKTTLDISVYKNRLLFFRPTLSILSPAATPVLNQSVYFSALFNPFTSFGPNGIQGGFIQDIAGNGGQITAATGDILISEEPLRDAIVVNFSSSTWLLRFTGIDFLPYRFDKINSTKSNNAPYASTDYDERTTSIGSKGLTACDGTNVQRYDISIIDYYEMNISEQYYGQCFSQRYDNLNQTWMLYVSTDTPYPLQNGNVAPGSDSALIYNFLENSWATYKFDKFAPMTCIGLYHNITGTTWAQLPIPWQQAQEFWNSYQNQALAPILLMGDINGNVYQMDNELVATDNGISIIPDIITTQWNPAIQLGQKIQFGYIDIYYLITPQTPPVQVTLNFYLDNSDELALPALSRTLTLDGPSNAEYTFKRIYLSLVGQFVQMEIDPVNKNAFMQFVGFILWARPAGRLPGP